MPSNLLLELKDAALGYIRYQPIISQVNFKIHQGDSVLITGANGSGKSTLIKSIIGLHPLLGGTINYKIRKHEISFVLQNDSLPHYAPISVLDFLKTSFPSYRHQFQEKYLSVLSKVGMEQYAQELFFNLSGGQIQRLFLARALLTESKLLVLDEPTSNIDAETEVILGTILKSMNIAIIVISHSEGWLNCTRQLIVKEGKLYE